MLLAAVTFKLDEPFLVLATQNPIEQEGTYPLPEAQLDRFQMHVAIDYPKVETEKDILKLAQEGWSSLHSVIKENEFWEVIDELKKAGAEGILVIPIAKMVL